jgi:hypothetical protein
VTLSYSKEKHIYFSIFDNTNNKHIIKHKLVKKSIFLSSSLNVLAMVLYYYCPSFELYSSSTMDKVQKKESSHIPQFV